MCHYKITAHNEDGYVIICQGCHTYQLAFGTIAVSFRPEVFKTFRENVIALIESSTCNGLEKQKRFQVDVFCESAMMVLNYQELKKLNTLLEESSFIEEIELLLEQCHITPCTP